MAASGQLSSQYLGRTRHCVNLPLATRVPGAVLFINLSSSPQFTLVRKASHQVKCALQFSVVLVPSML